MQWERLGLINWSFMNESCPNSRSLMTTANACICYSLPSQFTFSWVILWNTNLASCLVLCPYPYFQKTNDTRKILCVYFPKPWPAWVSTLPVDNQAVIQFFVFQTTPQRHRHTQLGQLILKWSELMQQMWARNRMQ